MTDERPVLGLFADRGFTLEEPDDHVVRILHEGLEVGTYSQRSATQESLQAECARHLVAKHGWDACLWDSREQRVSPN